MKKFIITSLFSGVMAMASFAFAEEVKEESIEPIMVVCPTPEEESIQTTDDVLVETTTEENK